MNHLIADSGATKTDWAYIDEGKPVFIKTAGLHPAYLDPKKARKELRKRLMFAEPHYISFYGAGCYSREAAMPVLKILQDVFNSINQIDVFDDLTAVAHAFLDDGDGVACILGTGSASGQYETGKKITSIASLGYVLGDEGSGADIGKRILKAFFRKEFTEETMLYVQSRLSDPGYGTAMQELYTTKRPSYYLAKVSETVLSDDFPEELAGLVDAAFQDFVVNHLKKYEGFPEYSLAISGGMASLQQERLISILKRNHLNDFTISGGVIAALARNSENFGRATQAY